MFRSATTAAAFRSFMAQLPQMYIHNEVSALGQSGAAAEPVAAGRPSAERSGAEAAMQAALNAKAKPIRRDEPKVGRNDACPCGSGKKYKKCCGANL